MQSKGYNAKGDKRVILECRSCGFQMPYPKKMMNMMRPVCRLCHGTKWRRVD